MAGDASVEGGAGMFSGIIVQLLFIRRGVWDGAG